MRAEIGGAVPSVQDARNCAGVLDFLARCKTQSWESAKHRGVLLPGVRATTAGDHGGTRSGARADRGGEAEGGAEAGREWLNAISRTGASAENGSVDRGPGATAERRGAMKRLRIECGFGVDGRGRPSLHWASPGCAVDSGSGWTGEDARRSIGTTKWKRRAACADTSVRATCG